MSIQGLSYIRDYITERHAATLLALVSESWDTFDSEVDLAYHGNLPRWADTIAASMSRDHIFYPEPNMVKVSEFGPDFEVKYHFESRKLYGPTIAALSLGAPLVVHFRNLNDPNEEQYKIHKVLLEPRSLLVITGSARYWWQWSIGRGDYVWKGLHYPRERHIRITFREELDEFEQIEDDLIYDMKALGGILA